MATDDDDGFFIEVHRQKGRVRRVVARSFEKEIELPLVELVFVERGGDNGAGCSIAVHPHHIRFVEG